MDPALDRFPLGQASWRQFIDCEGSWSKWRDIKRLSTGGSLFHFDRRERPLELKVGFAAPVEIGHRHVLSIEGCQEDLLFKDRGWCGLRRVETVVHQSGVRELSHLRVGNSRHFSLQCRLFPNLSRHGVLREELQSRGCSPRAKFPRGRSYAALKGLWVRFSSRTRRKHASGMRRTSRG